MDSVGGSPYICPRMNVEWVGCNFRCSIRAQQMRAYPHTLTISPFRVAILPSVQTLSFPSSRFQLSHSLYHVLTPPPRSRFYAFLQSAAAKLCPDAASLRLDMYGTWKRTRSFYSQWRTVCPSHSPQPQPCAREDMGDGIHHTVRPRESRGTLDRVFPAPHAAPLRLPRFRNAPPARASGAHDA
ncbi:hypothetical protein B0H16DRAFT_121769 [Mycena metata]|uniref:Uncharacterized protein n=1 Tax=Mycena metata TaxID=1033252 RepID=A0AAD7I884_9AGAR|nr:hypothetical protein B0H16DRAFT_121769 [Mycena metata]